MERIPFCILYCILLAAGCLLPVTQIAGPVYAGGDEQMSPPQYQDEKKEMKVLATSVLYRERILLPPGSTLTVTLEDVSRMDVPADIITYTTVDDIKTPPYDVDLQYDPGKIKEKMRYSVRARIENGGRLLFTNTSHLNPFAGNPDKPVEILVQKVGPTHKSKTVDAPLQNTYWKLLKLSGREAELGEDGKELSMVLTIAEKRVRGYAGCNNFTGSYNTAQDKLSFSQMAATLKMCVKGMEQEQEFLSVLNKTTGFAIHGESLTLFDEADQPIAEFASRYMQ